MTETGLTGNIGSGKTTVCRIFESLGVPVFYSDVEAKKFYFDEEIKYRIRQTLGEKVFNIKDEIDFKRLAGVIFNDKEALGFINNLIHPLVFKRYERWKAEHADFPYLIHESAILFEHHLEKRFRNIIAVYCPRDIRIKRVMQRDGASEDEVVRRMASQMDDAVKNRLASFVINNDGKEMLIPQVVKLHEKLITSKK